LKNFAKSKAYFKQQLNVSLDIKNRFLTISALNSLGVVYLQCKELESALRCFSKSLFLINKFQDTTDIKVDLLVKQYFLVGDCYLKLNMLVKARDTFRGQLALLNGLLNQKQMDENSESESYFLEISKAQLNLGIN
jgi:tetratricopeptide (TPR) repeat protein